MFMCIILHQAACTVYNPYCALNACCQTHNGVHDTVWCTQLQRITHTYANVHNPKHTPCDTHTHTHTFQSLLMCNTVEYQITKE